MLPVELPPGAVTVGDADAVPEPEGWDTLPVVVVAPIEPHCWACSARACCSSSCVHLEFKHDRAADWKVDDVQTHVRSVNEAQLACFAASVTQLVMHGDSAGPGPVGTADIEV